MPGAPVPAPALGLRVAVAWLLAASVPAPEPLCDGASCGARVRQGPRHRAHPRFHNPTPCLFRLCCHNNKHVIRQNTVLWIKGCQWLLSTHRMLEPHRQGRVRQSRSTSVLTRRTTATASRAAACAAPLTWPSASRRSNCLSAKGVAAELGSTTSTSMLETIRRTQMQFDIRKGHAVTHIVDVESHIFFEIFELLFCIHPALWVMQF